MKEAVRAFLEIKVYQKKFLGGICSTLFVGAVCFGGAAVFFTGIWAGNHYQEMQECFMRIERKAVSVREQLNDYVNTLYGSRSKMQDVKALFEADSEQAYLKRRKENSSMSAEQIAYLPGDMRKLFLNSRIGLCGVTLVSESGIKAIWLDRESGYIRTTYGLETESEALAIPGFGDRCLLTASIRDADSINRILGQITFWVNKRDLYHDASMAGGWAVLQRGIIIYEEYGMGLEESWIQTAEGRPETQGWFLAAGKEPVFYMRFDSGQSDVTYVSVASSNTLIESNWKGFRALSATIALLAAGAIAISFVGLCNESLFLSHIMQMLGAMEQGSFAEAESMEFQVGRQNEYGVIAAALRKVSRKLEGYINKEYILKLKQQEAAMRALRNQINPHFLYNTLESIRAKALVLGDEETAEAIGQLGGLYRSLVRSPEVISLKEEFSHMELYLKIMALRFRDNFVYQLELDEEAGKLETLSFWLQPLAENFFSHGIDRNSDLNLLIVEGCRKKGGVEIIMTDNGLGIMEERLTQIRTNMYGESDDSGLDIGLRNVYTRLKYYYGEGFSMKIKNNAEGGVRITIFIPFLRKGAGNHVHPVNRG